MTGQRDARVRVATRGNASRVLPSPSGKNLVPGARFFLYWPSVFSSWCVEERCDNISSAYETQAAVCSTGHTPAALTAFLSGMITTAPRNTRFACAPSGCPNDRASSFSSRDLTLAIETLSLTFQARIHRHLLRFEACLDRQPPQGCLRILRQSRPRRTYGKRLQETT